MLLAGKGALVPTDEELVAAFRHSGQKQHLDDLVRRHITGVRCMIYQMVLDDNDADDLTQEVFLRAIRGLGRFKGDARFGTWLYRVAMNTTYSFLARRKRSPIDPVAEVPEGADSRNSRPENLAMQNELDQTVRAALEALSPSLRAAIGLTTLQGLGIKEAARIEGCTTATMYWRIHQARKILWERLARHLSP